MSNLIELKVPDIGGHSNVDIIEVFIVPGQTVSVDDSLITLETDKATMEVPAETAGVIKEVKAVVGGKISEGDVIAILEVGAAASAPAPAAAAPAPAAAPAAAPAPAAAAPAAAPAASGRSEIRVPDIGGHNGVDVIEVTVKVGDDIAVDDSLITLETDKATMEVPASAAGRVVEVKVKVGDKVSEGDLIVVVEGAVAAASVPAAAAPAPAAAPAAPVPAAAAPAVAPVAAAVAAAIDEIAFSKAHAGPSVRRLARELGVDLGKVKGNGRKGRITEDDVKAFVKGVMQNPASLAPAAAPAGSGAGLDLLPWPKVDFAKFGPIETKPLSRIQKISGANLSRNWVMIPHVTFNDECDITELEDFRKTVGKEWEKSGLKISPLAFIIKAAAEALKAFPTFNSSLDGDNLVLKQYYHIGFAADTPNGLVVPVIKDADKKGLRQIAQELTDLSKLAREGKLKPTDMQGATFTISSLGGIGGTSFTPIVNAPEVAILGVCKSQIKPVWNGKEFAPRLMCPLSLSFDHRVIDGAAAARFTVHLGKLLSDVRRLIL
ncbi:MULTISPECIES: dihydrolipoyllysine-residue acetyltransferase [Chromobacterium]|uniref:Acetyltransferase component of pyruvate dehydrogenase complex n=2 Tax=Chromobacterium TaxID=535 RepID=A0ABS3GGJ9_9NEIS|nr:MULTISPECIES: dihydrolipoyllysine-residue acetyltransferase [Chromobacterium]AXT48565.1 dihydrolipoyllysine-residue acetyltransferase [Chromobacterium rhizoryzae]MBK0412952.1 dihydrolipoyllysine-residue acetyltransferase [Chromobacterium haemolyticum]MBO0414054.1 dihydrolipoyllysine-residue acetyltransferase [Chromobacterium haemolyticum]MBO0497314.1 dihydrolipoyllysine-residue acetyltransferase [Chromobacterium haemolyticum]MDH0341924.1 dihydrolipoyllysine-residue acetyltransferase [Chromo